MRFSDLNNINNTRINVESRINIARGNQRNDRLITGYLDTINSMSNQEMEANRGNNNTQNKTPKKKTLEEQHQRIFNYLVDEFNKAKKTQNSREANELVEKDITLSDLPGKPKIPLLVYAIDNGLWEMCKLLLDNHDNHAELKNMFKDQLNTSINKLVHKAFVTRYSSQNRKYTKEILILLIENNMFDLNQTFTFKAEAINYGQRLFLHEDDPDNLFRYQGKKITIQGTLLMLAAGYLRDELVKAILKLMDSKNVDPTKEIESRVQGRSKFISALDFPEKIWQEEKVSWKRGKKTNSEEFIDLRSNLDNQYGRLFKAAKIIIEDIERAQKQYNPSTQLTNTQSEQTLGNGKQEMEI